MSKKIKICLLSLCAIVCFAPVVRADDVSFAKGAVVQTTTEATFENQYICLSCYNSYRKPIRRSYSYRQIRPRHHSYNHSYRYSYRHYTPRYRISYRRPVRYYRFGRY